MVASEAWRVRRPERAGAAAGEARPRSARPTTVVSYLREIGSARVLTRDEEAALAEEIRFYSAALWREVLAVPLVARRVVRRWSELREAKRVTGRIGLAGGREHTLEEIGGRLGLSRERVRQIESMALARLRAMAARERPPRAVPEEGVA